MVIDSIATNIRRLIYFRDTFKLQAKEISTAKKNFTCGYAVAAPLPKSNRREKIAHGGGLVWPLR